MRFIAFHSGPVECQTAQFEYANKRSDHMHKFEIIITDLVDHGCYYICFILPDAVQ